MRLFLIIIFSLFFLQCFSQKQNDDLQANYQVYIDGDYPITYPSILYIRNQVSIYQTKPGLKQEWSEGKVKSGLDSYVSTVKTINDDYLKINHATKEVFFFDILPTTSILVTDNYPELNWVISTEKKNVIGYSCLKATANYRGRTWVAWFSPDIAMPYGPWKLHGLPGLILEAYDKDEMFKMQIAKVEKIKSDLFDRDFKTFRLTHNSKPITYKQFLEDSDEAMINMVKQMNSDGENVELIIPPRTGYELKYEWEK